MSGPADRPIEVRLRPLSPAEADAIDAEYTPELNVHSWFGARPADGLRRRVESGEALGHDHGSFAISSGSGRLLGDVGWRRVATGPTPASFCYDIGLYVLAAERGKGAGTAGQRLMAEYLFAATLTQRVQASTDVENAAEQRALEKAGFTREGVLRAYQYRSGAWHDMVSYAKLRGER